MADTLNSYIETMEQKISTARCKTTLKAMGGSIKAIYENESYGSRQQWMKDVLVELLLRIKVAVEELENS